MKKFLVILFLFPLFLRGAAPLVPVWDLGRETPFFTLMLRDVYRHSSAYALLPDGTPALQLDLSRSIRPHWQGLFSQYRLLPDFTRAVLHVRYFVPPSCGISSVTVLLCDRYNEQFPLVFTPECTPGWHTAKLPLDAQKHHPEAWKTNIRSRQDDPYPGGGTLNYYDMPMRVIGINGVCDLSTPPEARRIAFGPVSLEVTASQGAIRPVLETGTPFHVLKKGEEKRLAVSFFNPEQQTYRGSAEIEIADAMGKSLQKFSRSFTIPAGTKFSIPLKAPEKFGVCLVRVLSRGEGKKDTILSGRFCYLDPAGATPGLRAEGFLFGIVTHYPQWRIDLETEAEAMALCGAKVMREGTLWRGAQPDPGLPLSLAFFDDALAPFEKLGIEFQPILSPPAPQWAFDPAVKPVFPGPSNCPKELSCIGDGVKGREKR